MLRMCPSCRALLDDSESLCPHCGAPLGSARMERLNRSLAVVMPRHCPVTTLLIGACVLNLLVGMALLGSSLLLQPTGGALRRLGALVPLLFSHGEYWRLVTYAYVHIGPMHIVFNMMALSQVGTVVENEIGSARLFVVYTVALLAGGLADIVFRGPSVVVIAGASGALFGLIGFGVTYAHLVGGAVGRAQRNFYLQWAAYGFLFGFLVRADNICHLGGFAAGALLGLVVGRERSVGFRAGAGTWLVVALVLVAATVGAFVWMIAAGSRG